jgi:hypothetical protein
MEELVARWLREKYPDVLAPKALLDVPIGWSHIAFGLLDKARALDARVSVSEIVRTDGMMCVSLRWSGDMQDCSDDLWAGIWQIATDARTLSAWSCAIDGRPAWSVDTPRGPEVLCEWCQQEQGIRVDIRRRGEIKARMGIKCDEA